MSSAAPFCSLNSASLALSPVALKALRFPLPPSWEEEDRLGFLKAKGLQACFSGVDQLVVALQRKES